MTLLCRIGLHRWKSWLRWRDRPLSYGWTSALEAILQTGRAEYTVDGYWLRYSTRCKHCGQVKK